MKLRTWILVGSGVLVALLAICAGYIMLSHSMGSMCGYELKDQQIAPDGRRKAAVVEVDCGATTSYVTWVVMTRADAAFRYEKARVAVIEGRTGRIKWDGSKLVIFYPATRPPHVDKQRAGDIELRTL